MNKKIFILASAVLSIGALASCNGGSSSSTSSTKESPVVTKIEAKLKTDKTYHIGETLNKSDIEVTATLSDSSTKVVADADWSCDTFKTTTSHVITSDDCAIRSMQVLVSYQKQVYDLQVDTFDYKCSAYEWNEIIDYYQNGNNGSIVRNFEYKFKDGPSTVNSFYDNEKIKYQISMDELSITQYFFLENKSWIALDEATEGKYAASYATSEPNADIHLDFLGEIRLGELDTRTFDDATHTYTLPGEDSTTSQVNLDMIKGKIYMVNTLIENQIQIEFSNFKSVEVTIPEYTNLYRLDAKKSQEEQPRDYLGISNVTITPNDEYVILVDFEKLGKGMKNPKAYFGKYFEDGSSYISNIDSVLLNGVKMKGVDPTSGYIAFDYTFTDSDKVAITLTAKDTTLEEGAVYSFVLIEDAK